MATKIENTFERYLGNGVVTDFPVNFEYKDKAYVKVYLKRKDGTQVATSDYDWTDDKTIKFPKSSQEPILQVGDVLVIQRETPNDNPFIFENQTRLFPESVMNADDRQSFINQEQQRDIARCVKVPATETVTPEEMYQEFLDGVQSAKDNAASSENSANNSAASAVEAKGYAEQAKATSDAFDQNAAEKTAEFNANASRKQNDFDVNAATLTARFDNNYKSKNDAFNLNVTDSTNAFNLNVSTKIDDFDAHAMVKEIEFDDNASLKTSEFNSNATAKQTLVDESARKAKESEVNAKTSETNSKTSENNAKNSENASGISEDNARESERLAREYKEDAQLSATNAKTSEDNAKISENNSSTFASNAKTSEDNAATSETNSSDFATKANQSELNAKASELNAKVSQEKAKSSEDKCIELVNSLQNVYKFKGSVPTRADLPTTDNTIGDVWNVLDSDINYAWTGTEWDALGGASTDLSDYVTKQAGMLLERDEEVTSSKTFLKDQAIKSPDLDIRTDRSKRGNGLIFTDKNGTQTAGIGVYVNNNQSPECRLIASNGTQSAFAGLGVTTDGQGFFEVPTPSETSNNRDAINSEWITPKLNSLKEEINGKQPTGNYQTTDNLSQTIDTSSVKYPSNKAVSTAISNIDLSGKQDVLTPSQLSAVNSGITSDKVSTYDGYKSLIDGKQPVGNYQTTGNLSQTLDASSSKYPSNKAVATAIANIDLSGKQDVLNSDQLSAVNSGITSQKVSKYDSYETTLSGKADISLSNITEQGKNIANWSNNVTNCITYIPQDVKLELNNGTLTLKAGSKVYLPDGSIININSDVEFHKGTVGSGTDKFVIFVSNTGAFGARVPDSKCYSGDTAQSNMNIWFDTQNNIIKYSKNADGNFSGSYSLPVGVYQRTNGVATSIDKVFNGFGYIGSTAYGLPGVRGLIPNYKNPDGSYKSIEVVLDKVTTSTNGGSTDTRNWVLNIRKGIAHPELSGYDEKKNVVWESRFNGQEYKEGDDIIFATSSFNAGRITSFKPKQVFRALDYNDKSDISGWGMPSEKVINLSLGASGSEYQAPANGYFSVGLRADFVDLACVGTTIGICAAPRPSDKFARAFVPVKKGQKVLVFYSGLVETAWFRFYFAEGDR